MASTPPPPERIHTPPAPHLGSRYDDWEPYSPPRRSSRVAAQRSRHALGQQSQDLDISKKRSAPRSTRAFTPTGSGDLPAPTSSFATSPPSSPSSPQKRPSVKKSAHRVMFDDQLLTSDNDSDPFFTSSRDSLGGVFPTPSKTPSKKDKARPISAFAQTARILFHDRPANIEDAMPSPRKNRKNKKHTSFSFMDECDDDSHEKIEIYTDFRERVPSFDEEEDNPFITKKPDENDEPHAGPSTSPRVSKRRLTKEEDEMERRARDGEGFISVFRGKKIFTEFKEGSDDSGSDSDNLASSPTRRAVGSMARRRVTRSSIQPRLLFPTAEQKRAREAAAAPKAAEEDSTDVDASVQLATPRKRAHKARAPRSAPAEARDATPEPAPESTPKTVANTTTPATQRFFEPVTPPPSRTTRASAKKDANVEPPQNPADGEAGPSNSAQNDDQEPKPVFAPMPRPAKRSPFDQWRRTKAGVRSVSGTKREGEPLEVAGAKRTRSSARASTPSAG